MNDQEHEIKINISGKTVYKAVAAYLSNSDELKAMVAGTIRLLTDQGKLQGCCERLIKDALSNYWAEQNIRKVALESMREYVEKEIKIRVDAEVQAAIRRNMQNMVYFGGNNV